MSNYVRREALELFAGALDWLSDDFLAVIYDEGFTPDEDTTARLSDIPAPNRQLVVAVNSGKTVTNGVLAADNPAPQTFPSPDVSITGMLLVHDTGVESTSEVLSNYDHTPANLPIRFLTDADPARIKWPADTIGDGFITL